MTRTKVSALRACAAAGAGLAVFLAAAWSQAPHAPDLRTAEAAAIGWLAGLSAVSVLWGGALGPLFRVQALLAPAVVLLALLLAVADRVGTRDALAATSPLVGLLAFGHGTGSLARERGPPLGRPRLLAHSLVAACAAALGTYVGALAHLPPLTAAAGVLLALGLLFSTVGGGLPERSAQVLSSAGVLALVLVPSLAVLEAPLSLFAPFPAPHWLFVGVALFCAGWVEGRWGAD